MKFFQRKYIFLILSISNIFAVPYSRYKRSDDSPQNGHTHPSEQTTTILTSLPNDFPKSSITTKSTPESHSSTNTVKIEQTNDQKTKPLESISESHTKSNFGQPTTTEGKITHNPHKKKEMVSQNIEIKPFGIEISGVENRFSCLLKLPSGKRVCKPLNFFIILSHNTYDCQDRNIEIAFRGYNLELEESDEYISSFLNLSQGEIEGSQLRENTCFNYKK
jgi:hypothetical protein